MNVEVRETRQSKALEDISSTLSKNTESKIQKEEQQISTQGRNSRRIKGNIVQQ